VTRRHVLRAVLLMALAVTLIGRADAQEGHPLVGTWYGAYESGSQKYDLTVIMNWDGKAITGLINPGPKASPLKSAVLTITPGKPAPEGQNSTQGIPPVFQVRFEVDGMAFEGTVQNPVAGNRRITGNWSRGTERGTFQIRRL
jgi:hypothetical protein